MDVGSLIGGGGLVTLILGTGAGVWRWVDRQDKKKDPIPKDAAAVALAQSGVTLMQAVAKDLETRLTALSGSNQLLEQRVSAAEGTIAHHEHLFTSAMSYIEALLRHIREGRPWPPSPAPADLRDLIDPTLHD